MSLATQTQAFTDIGGPIPGDCWRTAIACLLELERDDVPHFIHLYAEDENPTRWWHETVTFVESTMPDYTLKLVNPDFPIYEEDAFDRVVLTGASPRGDWLHAVVADSHTGNLVHDPHPDGTGVLSKVDVAALTGRLDVPA